MDKAAIIREATNLFKQLEQLEPDECIDTINALRLALHEHSPLKEHPVDCVLWVKQDEVQANEYNPNFVAPPEMELLKRSILEDGFTQPSVVWQEEERHHEIIDGFHRWLTSKDMEVYAYVQGRLPVTIANQNKTGLAARMASTIRHNRARGVHNPELMQGIVAKTVELGMSDRWIMKQFGMDTDELLRLKALTGLATLFKDKEFSRSWVADETV